MKACTNPECIEHVICRYIRRNGKKIYPKRARYFSFCVLKKAARIRIKKAA